MNTSREKERRNYRSNEKIVLINERNLMVGDRVGSPRK